MPTVTQRSFSSGELDPALQGRVDTNKYGSGLKTMVNAYVMKSGGAANRPGSEFVAEVKDSSKPVELIKFVFNNAQTYVLEFGDHYMRVHQKGVQLTLPAKNITAITKANPGVVTSTAHGYVTGDEIYISGILGMTELSNRSFRVQFISANTYSLKDLNNVAVNTTSLTTYVSGGISEKVYELATDYDYIQISELKFVQSADTIIIVHPDFPPKKLVRLGHTSWTIGNISLVPSIANPVISGHNGGGIAPTDKRWVMTAVGANFEESLPSPIVGPYNTPTVGNPATLTWSAVPDATEYNIFREKDGTFGLIGSTQGLTFKDVGVEPDVKSAPPVNPLLFNAVGKYPAAVTIIQQRLAFAASDLKPETIWLSRIGKFYNFTKSFPTQDDDSVEFTMAGRQVNEVKHLLDLGTFVALTSGGEHTIGGDSNGTITPTTINVKQQSYNGSSDLPPIPIDGSALYVQGRGSIIRDMAYSQEAGGYRGNDLTVFSAHMFKGQTIRDWDYQQNFDSIVWVVRDDGIMLSCTYLKEHQIVGWARHEFDGAFVENVCVVPENDIDAVYVVVRRDVNGVTKRYVERLQNRFFLDEINAAFMDSRMSYDGRNLNTSHTMTMSGGTTWGYEEEITLTSSMAFFTAGDVGNQIHGYFGDDILRLSIVSFTSSTVVKVTPHKTVPVSYRNQPWVIWARAVDELSGLHHLEGKDVSVFADRYVVGSPYNESYTPVVVENGKITLDKCYSVIHVGLPFITDLETLDIDVAQGETLQDKRIAINDVTIKLEKTRGLFIGPAQPKGSNKLEGLNEMKLRNQESMDEGIRPFTGNKLIKTYSDYKTNGRVFLRQVDPLPLQILSISPSGFIPIRG